MKPLGWNAWCLIAGLAVFAVTLFTPAWHWAIRCQGDYLFGRVRTRAPLSERLNPLFVAKMPRGFIPDGVLDWRTKERNFKGTPLFPSPRNTNEEIANALWLTDAGTSHRRLQAIADQNPRCLPALALLASEGKFGQANASAHRAGNRDRATKPHGARFAAARAGARLDPENAFWQYVEIATYDPPDHDELCEALGRACGSTRYEDPRTAFGMWFTKAVSTQLGRGNRVAAYAGIPTPQILMMHGRLWEKLGEDRVALKARLGFLKIAQMLSKSGSAIDIIVAALNADMATDLGRHPGPRGPAGGLSSAKDFELRAAAAGVDLGGFDVVRSLREQMRMAQAVGADERVKVSFDEPTTDFDLLGAVALIAALLAWPCALLSGSLQARMRPEFRALLPPILAGFASIPAVASGHDLAFIPGLLLLVTVLPTMRSKPLSYLVTGLGLVACVVGAFFDPMWAVPGAAFLLSWAGNKVPEKSHWSAPIALVATAGSAGVLGFAVVLALIHFPAIAMWFLVVAAAVVLSVPHGRLGALQMAGPLILLFAVTHGAFVACQVHQDAYYARLLAEPDNSGDRIRAKAATLPLP